MVGTGTASASPFLARKCHARFTADGGLQRYFLRHADLGSTRTFLRDGLFRCGRVPRASRRGRGIASPVPVLRGPSVPGRRVRLSGHPDVCRVRLSLRRRHGADGGSSVRLRVRQGRVRGRGGEDPRRRCGGGAVLAVHAAAALRDRPSGTRAALVGGERVTAPARSGASAVPHRVRGSDALMFLFLAVLLLSIVYAGFFLG